MALLLSDDAIDRIDLIALVNRVTVVNTVALTIPISEDLDRSPGRGCQMARALRP